MKNTFHIDETNSDETYLYIDIPSKNASIVIKREDNGIVIDIFPAIASSEPVASLWVHDNDIQLDK